MQIPLRFTYKSDLRFPGQDNNLKKTSLNVTVFICFLGTGTALRIVRSGTSRMDELLL
jgi:hypothetical protein